jgi:hypothetical protein
VTGPAGESERITNLQLFNEAIREGKSLEDAARATKTGQYADMLGYTDVKVPEDKLKGPVGDYTHVEAFFTKPQ